MGHFDSRFIADLSLEASRLMKAIRSIQALEACIPAGFPEPTTIKASRKPYDLVLEWDAEHPKHAKALENRITRGLGLVDVRWRHNYPTTEVDTAKVVQVRAIVCYVNVGALCNANLKLQLRINLKTTGTSG